MELRRLRRTLATRNESTRLPNTLDEASNEQIETAIKSINAGRHAAHTPPPAIEPDVDPADALPDDFDEQLYLTLNPDVADAVAKGVIPSAIWHWVNHGIAEEAAGARPSINEAHYYRAPPNNASEPPTPTELADFDAQTYFDANPDVRTALGGQLDSALDHWIKHGRFESRPYSKNTGLRHRTVMPAQLAERPFGVNLFAPFTARSGLGTAARGYLRALRAAGIPVHLVNIDMTVGQIRIAARDYDLPPPYRINLIQVNADTISRFYSLFRAGWLDNAYCIAIWAWELNMLRPDWYPTFAVLDEVWTLSDYNTDAVQPIAPIAVRTMNPVVTAPPPVTLGRDYFALPSGFVFLTAFDVGSSLMRKNPDAVVDAFIEAFGDRTDIHLVLKFHSAKNDLSGVKRLLQRVRGQRNISIRSEVLRDDEMRALQSCADCLVSAHRSEGFGLNLAEFMLTGKPVIATGATGNMDFTGPDNSYLIPHAPHQLTEASGPYFPGYLWAEPDRTALAALMRDVVESPEKAAQIGARGAETIRTRLSPDAIGQRILARFHELELVANAPAYMRSIGRSVTMPAQAPGLLVPLSDPGQIAARPTLSVIVPVYNVPPKYLVACIESVRAQSWPHWELCLCDDASTNADTVAALQRYQGIDPRIRIKRLVRNKGISGASNAAATMATGGWLVMLDNDDELTPNALAEIAQAVIQNPAIDALYSDEDKLDADGVRCDTCHKPGWSPEHLESVMYTLHPLTVRTSLFLGLGGFRTEYSGAQDWDLMLRISRTTEAIHHIPKILYHWRMIPGSASAEVDAKPDALKAGARALADHVAAKYGPGNGVAEEAPLTGHYRVRHAVHGKPPVSLVITTNNVMIELPGRKPFVMFENLVESIREKTEYANYQIIVIDNGNTPEKTKRALAKDGVELHTFKKSPNGFNYPDMVNFGLRQVETEHVVFMNDDMEVINKEWLSALLEFTQHPGVGACGGKLLHADGTIQHVGTVLGVNGGAAHVYHGFPGDYVGYNGYTHDIRNYAALTGACFATKRSVLNEVGRWDPRLAIDYNDVDLCLRMRQHGYRLVYTPYSQLYHFESKSAVRTSQNPAEVQLFKSRWNAVVENDPYYNPNLSRTMHDFSLR